MLRSPSLPRSPRVPTRQNPNPKRSLRIPTRHSPRSPRKPAVPSRAPVTAATQTMPTPQSSRPRHKLPWALSTTTVRDCLTSETPSLRLRSGPGKMKQPWTTPWKRAPPAPRARLPSAPNPGTTTSRRARQARRSSSPTPMRPLGTETSDQVTMGSCDAHVLGEVQGVSVSGWGWDRCLGTGRMPNWIEGLSCVVWS